MHQDHFGAFVPLAWGLMWFGFWTGIMIQGRRERTRLYDLVEKALDQGKPLPPEVLGRLRRHGGAVQDLRAGLTLVATGIGLAIAGVINYVEYAQSHPNSELFYGPYGLFPVPLLVGVAFLIVSYIRRDELKG